jgi:hypothetical protein
VWVVCLSRRWWRWRYLGHIQLLIRSVHSLVGGSFTHARQLLSSSSRDCGKSVFHAMEGAAPGDGKVVLDEGKVCGQDGKLADYKIVQPIGEALTPLSPLTLHTHWRDVCRLLSYRLPVAAAPPTSCAVAWPTAVCYGAQVQLGCIFTLLLARPPPPACPISILPPPAPATLHQPTHRHTHPHCPKIHPHSHSRRSAPSPGPRRTAR